jgi:outer membrane lipoprotein-sorting protein
MQKYLIYFLLAYVFSSTSIFGLTALEIIQKMENVRAYQTAQMQATMTIINQNQAKTSMRLISYEKTNGDKSLMRFTSPARLKGTAILTVGDNIWYYNRRTNRVRLLSRTAKQGSMMGSSFSYEDLDTNYTKNYTAQILKETKNHYFLKLIPKNKAKRFSYLQTKVSKKTFIPAYIEYYHQNQILYKKMHLKNIKKLANNFIPLHISMLDILEQKETLFLIDEKSITLNIFLADKLFSERNLKK